MTTIADGLKDVFLAGVGAMALGAEKTQELVEQLIAKGEITVEQGKEINSEELKRAQATGERVQKQAQSATAEAVRQAKAAASQAEERAKTAASLAKEDAESAVSWGRSQAEMAADAAKKAAGAAQQDAASFAEALKHDVLEAQMAMMTPEQRTAFAAKAAEIDAGDTRNAVEHVQHGRSLVEIAAAGVAQGPQNAVFAGAVYESGGRTLGDAQV